MEIELYKPAKNAVIDLIPQSQFPFLHGEKISGCTEDGKLISWDWRNPCCGESDDSFPEPVVFLWKCDIPADFSLFLSDNNTMSSPMILQCGTQCSRKIDNLKIGTRYFWFVAGYVDGCEVCRSEVSCFETNAQPPRWLRIPGISNVRDCGGWKSAFGGTVKQGMIFRGSEMDRHLNITDRGKAIMLDELSLRTELDIRSPEEIRKAGMQSVFGSERVSYVFYEIKPYNLFFQPENARMNAECFYVFLNPESYPVYCHCYGGADRTGTLIFMLLALLGVEDDDLIKDYELTTFSAFGARSCESEYFVSFRAALADYGSQKETFAVKAERYFCSIGIENEEIKKFRTILLN